jgi:hypothetical protein
MNKGSSLLKLLEMALISIIARPIANPYPPAVFDPKSQGRSWRNRSKFHDQVAPPQEITLPGQRGVIGAPIAMRRDIFDLLLSFAREQPVVQGRTGGQFDSDRDFNRLIAEFLGDEESRQWDNMVMLPWPQVYELVVVFSGEIWRRQLFFEFSAKLNPILEKHRSACRRRR